MLCHVVRDMPYASRSLQEKTNCAEEEEEEEEKEKNKNQSINHRLPLSRLIECP